MSQTPSPEGSIERQGKPSFQRPVLGLLFAAIPALFALVYLNFSQGNNEEGAQRTIAENFLAQRGALIKYEHDRLIKSVDQALAKSDAGDIERVVRQPGANVLFGPTACRLLPSFATQCGGAAEVTASPPPLMQRSGAIVAGDCRGSVLLKDRWFGSNDPLYNAARMAEVLSNDLKSVSELVSALPNTSVNDLTLIDSHQLHSTLFDILRDDTNFPGARITELDGVQLDFADSWVHLEPLKADGTAQLCFEGDDVDCRSRLEHLLVDVLKTKNPDLALPIA
jgi:hypothetical protein